ncbi:phenylalanine--tRNA ligase subunit beta [Thiolapillus brandeum]|uniref:Phenylalanine--tRNA ligase beta subunit n=1 Tax=Thiolapillus brandeum TaxID=1076588 RepID=A0A7U6JHF2_9GAMM|nr:phenylalanine--tRNA ligase subunit beta [Thiolapillus brandeum]BAO44241.1 phenylalanyl-tRNA synthetase beta chain [Thiolapillus brandeum]
MQFSESWLREWVNPQASTEELADALSMAGLEVDGVSPAAPAFNGVVIGKVLDCQRHPDADKLSVCQVDIGAGEPVQIVCGAKNVAADMKVPVAVVGAVLPGDFRIRKAKLRGQQSLGMICSASELGLAESSDGIMPLPQDAPVGDDFRAYLQLDDSLIDVDLTPDRGDCLSIAGIARDVGVIYAAEVTDWKIPEVPAGIDDRQEVRLEAAEACPRYTCRIVRGVDARAETPLWMVERLRRSGIRAISPVVDITNYVMIELGQPMHGFDLDRLSGTIHVRFSQGGEKLTLLDGSDVDVQQGTLLIADDEKPLALAGIMGGEASGVVEDTRDILLESAFFSPTAIIGKARAYGLHTDSSHRFERGVDWQLQIRALERATDLLLHIAGGEAGPVVEAVAGDQLPESPEIHLRRFQIPRILGVEIDDATISDILKRLGMGVETTQDGWRVRAPSWRFDIAIEADLVEEIGRIYGYANIPENLSSAPVSVQGVPEAALHLDRIKDLLVDRDYQEVVTYSFISPELAELLTPKARPIRLANPISADMSVMRASLWPGLLSTLQYNLARQQDRVRLFETGQIFLAEGEDIRQPDMFAGLIYGDRLPEQWANPTGKVDFYDLKGDVEAVLGMVDNLHGFDIQPVKDDALHPGQSAVILRNAEEIGRLGMLHPALQAKLDIPGNVFLFQIRLQGLEKGRIPAYAAVSRYPAIRRDLALLVGRDVSWGEVEAVARKAAPEIVRDIRIFDVYTGDNIDSGLKSLALSLILQDYSHTLTDEETERAVKAVLDALRTELSAKLRD